MNKKIREYLLYTIIFLIAIAVLITAIYLGFAGKKDSLPDETKLTEAQARLIAENSCIKGGEALSSGTFNQNSKTWWFDANLNSVREGCNPACVVSEETKTAEINWRCTGLIEPNNSQTHQCTCPSGYRKEGETCNPECYYSTPPCLAPSIKCQINEGEKCGIENCHGLDIICGKPAEVCTEIYMFGDRCRQFAKCEIVNGVCQQTENLQFTSCKSCALQCEKDFPNNPNKAFDCESKC